MRIAIFLSILVVAMVVSGCCGATTPPPAPSAGGTQGTNSTGTPAAPNVSQPLPAPSNPSGGTTANTSGTSVNQSGNTAPPAGSQVDCSTMTPSCGDCVAKPGCGWCKSQNGCFAGDPSGPAGDITCQPADWATDAQACQAPVGGGSCVSKTNCADCLSGTGCEWCILGSKCADVSTTDSCGSGGWKTQSFECHLG